MTKLLRRTHMYLALFLAPWMFMYAVSTLAMNHRELFVEWYGEPRAKWETERELDFAAASEADSETAAEEILEELDLQGHHDVRGRLERGEITVIRQDPFAPRRIKYRPGEGKLTVEREEVRIHSLLNRLHSRRGYQHGYRVEEGWAVSVDLAIVAMMFWALSGLWLWWTLPKTRVLGSLCLASGLGLFCLFLFTI